jgi:hypothetical protein
MQRAQTADERSGKPARFRQPAGGAAEHCVFGVLSLEWQARVKRAGALDGHGCLVRS